MNQCQFCSDDASSKIFLYSNKEGIICNNCVDLCRDFLEVLATRGYSIEDLENVFHINLRKIGLTPRFEKIEFKLKEKHCFHLCPFTKPFNTIYKDHIIPSVKSTGFSISRADDMFSMRPVINDIWEEINSAEVIIADVTSRNANVMYEIGMAHTVGKPVMIITQDIEDVPFDLRHHRCIVYDYTPRGCKTLEANIVNTLNYLNHGEI